MSTSNQSSESEKVEQALELARSLKYGPLPNKEDPTPSIPEALEILKKGSKGMGFTWITGNEAIETLSKKLA